jgi:uncharacterized protein (TIGR02266 family)
MAERTKDNTRRNRRQTLRILVDYVTESGVCCDYATTLGAGGMFLETDQSVMQGSIIKVRFRLPGGEELHEIEARVVWCRNPPEPGQSIAAGGAGIKFTDQTAINKLGRELEDIDL